MKASSVTDKDESPQDHCEWCGKCGPTRLGGHCSSECEDEHHAALEDEE